MTTTVEQAAPTERRPDIGRLQRRTLIVLMLTQMVGGIGVAIGIAVGALLAKRMGGTEVSGLGQSSLVVGAALLAVPVTRLMARRGRRPGLTVAYLTGAAGATLVVFAAARGSLPLLFLGLFLFGGGSAANYQARYSAVDLAEPSRRARQLSWVVWATTVGSVAGPNLAELADESVRRFGAVKYSGPFAFSAIAFLLAGVLVFLLLRPDPLLTARALAASTASLTSTSTSPGGVAASGPASSGLAAAGPASFGTASSAGPVSSSTASSGTASGGTASSGTAPSAVISAVPPSSGMAAAVREVLAAPAARLGIAAVAVGHLVMVGVMSMTPVHIDEAGHPDALRVVGLVLSVHIAGMYALSPVTGWLTDRIGRRPVILGGIALLVAACAVAGTAGHDTPRLILGLSLLGMGWSGTMVAGSTLLTESVGAANRPSVQGLSDLVMGLAAASAGALSGLVVAWSSYATLTALAAIATVPLVALALRPIAAPVTR